jgi:hypothetical protein
MIAPAAQTFKGLAKAFVSSAGGKGPETFRGALRPLFLAPSTSAYSFQRVRGIKRGPRFLDPSPKWTTLISLVSN